MDSLKKYVMALGLTGAITISAALLPQVEGKENVAYQDGGATQTICFGHAKNVKAGQRATDQQCLEFGTQDLLHAHAVVRRYVTAPLTDEQEAGLALFVVNVGETAFRKSTLLRLFNAGHPKACDQLRRWEKVRAPAGSVKDMRDGKRDGFMECSIRANNCYGLVTRRELERQLCIGN